MSVHVFTNVFLFCSPEVWLLLICTYLLASIWSWIHSGFIVPLYIRTDRTIVHTNVIGNRPVKCRILKAALCKIPMAGLLSDPLSKRMVP